MSEHTERKRNSQRVEDELHEALQSHGETAIVGDLRSMVAHTLGLPLDGKHRWRFEQALFKLLRPPPRKRRARCRVTSAEGGLGSETCSSKRPWVESA